MRQVMALPPAAVATSRFAGARPSSLCAPATSLQLPSPGRLARYSPTPFTGSSCRLAWPALLSVPRPVLRPVHAQGSSDEGGGSTPEQPQQPQQPPQQGGSLVGSAGIWLLWAALIAYAFFLAPNQTPLRDQYFLEKLVGLGADDGVTINAVFTQLFFIMGVWPLVYTALLIPSGRSASGLPAWPFVTASYAVGAFGLLPYMALWQPPSPPPKVPAVKEELEGFGNLMQKGMETPIPALLALVGGAACLWQAIDAGAPAWTEYFKLLEESRFVHVTTLDFLTLTALAPFWMSNDAELRQWGPRAFAVPLLSVLPVLGPCIYLCLRPRTQL